MHATLLGKKCYLHRKNVKGKKGTKLVQKGKYFAHFSEEILTSHPWGVCLSDFFSTQVSNVGVLVGQVTSESLLSIK